MERKPYAAFFRWLTLAYPSHKLKYILQPNFKPTAYLLALLELLFPSLSGGKQKQHTKTQSLTQLLLLAKERKEKVPPLLVFPWLTVYIDRLSYFILLLLLWPWAKYVEVKKAGTTNGFRCNATECCVLQLFHIFSNAKPQKKKSL